MDREIIFDCGITKDSLEFFERNKEAFGEVTKVQMKSSEFKREYILTLENKNEEKMIFKRGFSSGYQGEGCRGTLKVLNDCGFDIDIEYIGNNPNFILEK